VIVLPLGFRFDVDAVVVEGVAHRSDCDRLCGSSADDATLIAVGGVLRAEWRPRVCPKSGRRARRC
jgi:hypothetical protein